MLVGQQPQIGESQTLHHGDDAGVLLATTSVALVRVQECHITDVLGLIGVSKIENRPLKKISFVAPGLGDIERWDLVDQAEQQMTLVGVELQRVDLVVYPARG